MRPVVQLAQVPGTLDSYRKAALQRAHGGDRVPDKVLRLAAIRPDSDRVARYAAVCGDRLTSVLPPLFPHLLGFPLQLALLTDPDSPFAAMGLVHVANEVLVSQPIPLGAALDVEVEMTPPLAHRRGRTIDLLARVSLDGEVAWRSVSTYLRRESGSEQEPLVATEPLPGAGSLWTLPADLGRQYGSVSGDRNPIHLSALTARAFGFPRAIAHGMWTAARCLAALEGRLPEQYRNEVSFRAPISLPGRVEFRDRFRSDGVDFQVSAPVKDRLHLVASVTHL